MLRRQEWLNLNGTWAFREDPKDQGVHDQWYLAANWQEGSWVPITVPFSPGSQASGVSVNDATQVVWYHRQFECPDWRNKDQKLTDVLLNIGACDYRTDVYVNGHHVGCHQGGYTPIQLSVAPYLKAGTNSIVVRAADTDSWQQPRGKQAGDTRWPIDYDAIIGIWQTVWLEPVAENYVTSIFARFDMNTGELSVTLGLAQQSQGAARVGLMRDDGPAQWQQASANNRNEVSVVLDVIQPQLWSPERPYLYDLVIELQDAAEVMLDRVDSYTGLREVRCEAGAILVNQKPVFLRGVLDQGYFPQGWYTAPDDETLRRDVELTKAMGFNFVRKHQKIEDPRYLYWADKLGLMVWAEMPAGRIFSDHLSSALTQQWPDALRRDRSHPSIVGWVVFNESWGIWHQGERPEQRHLADGLYHLTKSFDPSRPVIGNDGWEFSSGDIWALHSYEHDDGALADRLHALRQVPQTVVADIGRARQGALSGANPQSLPTVLSECGGVGFVASERHDEHAEPDFAYGDLPGSTEAFATKCAGLFTEIYGIPELSGFVWTQLTDVQQEINGLLYFDRTPKVPVEQIRCWVLDDFEVE